VPQPVPQQSVKAMDSVDENNYKKVLTCVKSEPSTISEVSELKAIVAKYKMIIFKNSFQHVGFLLFVIFFFVYFFGK